MALYWTTPDVGSLLLAASIVFAIVVAVFILFTLGRLPGKLARERRHMKAEAINVCGWLGLLLFPAWIVALVWSYTEDNRAAAKRGRLKP